LRVPWRAVLEAREPPLVLLRIEARQPITGDLKRELARQHGLLAVPVAAIAIALADVEMMIDLRVQCALGQSLLQLI
jgi:hypothetical protein